MRIAILAQGLRAAGGQSVGLNTLAALARVRPEYQYLVVMPEQPEYRATVAKLEAEVLTHEARGAAARLAFDWRDLSRAIKAFRPDWVWGLGNLGLTSPPGRQAILLHKAQMVYPARYRPGEAPVQRAKNAYIRFQLARALPHTDVVFCQTDVMRRRFRAAFGYAGRVELMPNAVSGAIAAADPTGLPDELRAVARPFKLFVLTRYYPHKNLERIVECFEQFPETLADVACVLTIAAEQHPHARRLLARIRAHALEQAIVNVGPLQQARIAAFYRHTAGLLLPTVLESFTGTYLEAMTLERPILTSDLDFAREICGDAALYFNPWNAASMRDAIVRLRDEEGGAERLVAGGRARYAQFENDWDAIVEHAVGVLESIDAQ